MAITKFGQYVLIEVHNEAGQLVFASDSLKIDFDVRHIQGWSRAKFSITNLANDTILKLSSSDNYVTLKTGLHGSELQLVAQNMYVSNALTEVKVPNRILNMFCYSKLRKDFLEVPIDIQVSNPNLANIVRSCARAAGFGGVVSFVHFPEEVLNFTPPKPYSRQRGTLSDNLDLLGKEYSFNHYTEGNKLVIMYRPDIRNVLGINSFNESTPILLDTNNLRSNPKLGPATLSVVSNLDPKIKPTSILDISNLIAIDTDVKENTLQVAGGFLKGSVAGYSRYQVLSVQHKGSNWDDVWHTQAVASSPSKGITMAAEKWWS